MGINNERDLVIEDDSGRVYWIDEAQTVEFEAKRYVSSDELRSVLGKILEIIEERNARKFLVDMSRMDRIEVDDLMWVEMEWFPRCLKAGLTFVAMIMPKSLDPLMVVDGAVDRVGSDAVKDFIRRIFTDLEDAREWLAHQ